MSESVGLVTISQDNDLQWIHDWAFFHVSECGVDSIVFYDNGSSRYAIGDVALALQEIAGLNDVILVRQDTTFGAIGFPEGGGASDSAYLKPAMFEHARHRFLALADLYINLDIDELLLMQRQKSLRALLDQAEPVTLVDRRDVENFSTSTDLEIVGRRHCHYWWRKKKPSSMLPKWIAQPRRCNPESVFTYHIVENEKSFRCQEDELVIAHFLAVTTGWKAPNRLQSVSAEKQAGLLEDLELRSRLDRIFSPGDSGYQPWTPFEGGDPALLLRFAHQLISENRLSEAELMVNRALDIDPTLLSGVKLRLSLHKRLGDEIAMEEDLRWIKRLTLDNPDWYYRRADYIRRKNVTMAIDILETAITLQVVSAPLAMLLGDMYERVGRLDDAKRAFDRVLELDESGSPLSERASLNLQRLHLDAHAYGLSPN